MIKNKTVFRCKNLKVGTYTMVPYHILRDKKLNSNAKILLIEILSDSDDFKLSQTVYCNRLGWDKKQFDRAMTCLIENGYIKRTQIDDDKYIPTIKKAGSKKIIYYYTVSEFGNLHQYEVQSKTVLPPSKERLDEFKNQIENNHFVTEAVSLIEVENFEDFYSNLDVFNELMDVINIETRKLQQEYIDYVKKSLRGYYSGKYPKTIIKKMDERIKQVVFDEGRFFKDCEFGGNNEAQKFWGTMINAYDTKQREAKIDYETKVFDSTYDD